jgi:hypothetical protein
MENNKNKQNKENKIQTNHSKNNLFDINMFRNIHRNRMK